MLGRLRISGSGSRRTRVRRGMSRVGLLSGAFALAGCAVGTGDMAQAPALPDTSAYYEFANMRPSNIVPNSTASAFVGAFERFCLDGGRGIAAISARLRAADYVEAPPRGQAGIRVFVVDDRRPMVQVSEDGRFCAVAARARTGQSARVESMISRRFPGARAVERSVSEPEFTLRIGGAHAGLLTLHRPDLPIPGSRVVLAVLYDS